MDGGDDLLLCVTRVGGSLSGCYITNEICEKNEFHPPSFGRESIVNGKSCKKYILKPGKAY